MSSLVEALQSFTVLSKTWRLNMREAGELESKKSILKT